MGLKNRDPEQTAADRRWIVQVALQTEIIAITALCLKIQTPPMEWDTEKFDWTPLFCSSSRSGRLSPRRGQFSLCGKPVQKSSGDRLLGISAYLTDRFSVA